MNRAQPEGIDLIVLERSDELRTEADLAELPHYLSDPRSLIWSDMTGIDGGQQDPYGRLLREVFGFDELTIEDCFTTNHLPKVDIYDDYLFVVFFSFHLSVDQRNATRAASRRTANCSGKSNPHHF